MPILHRLPRSSIAHEAEGLTICLYVPDFIRCGLCASLCGLTVHCLQTANTYGSTSCCFLRISFINSGVSFTAVLTDSEILDKILDFLETKGIFPETGDKI